MDILNRNMENDIINGLPDEEKDIASAIIDSLKDKSFGLIKIELEIQPFGYLNPTRKCNITIIGTPSEMGVQEFSINYNSNARHN